MFRFIWFAMILFGLATVSAQARAETWSVLVYWAVDNDLYEFSIPYLRQFEKVGSGPGLNLVVETDYPGKRKSERALILKNDGSPGRPNQDLPHSLILETLPQETRSARPRTLARFLEWGKKHFPADRYALVIGSHGMNWRGVIEDGDREEVMSLTGLRSVLRRFAHERGSPLDLLIFDACRMAFGETLYALRGGASYILGSQFDVNGFDHASPLAELRAHAGFPVRALAERYVQHYPHADSGIPNLSAAQLSAEPAVVDAFDRDVDRVAAGILRLDATEQASLRQRLQSTRNEYRDSAIDFSHLVDTLLEIHPDPQWVSLRARLLPAQMTIDEEGAQHLRDFRPDTPVQSSSSTRDSGPARGISLTCSSDPRQYALSPFGRRHPAWASACAVLLPPAPQ